MREKTEFIVKKDLDLVKIMIVYEIYLKLTLQMYGAKQ
jgi:hypothetical protein